jgi:uncharacterized protein (TIGR02266 family)
LAQGKSGGATVAVAWCTNCGTSHENLRRCPGPLLATGAERHGWRVEVETPRGLDVYGVLVAPVGQRYRARILTYPNVLWIVPGGGSIKFLGDDPQNVEARAMEFIREHCRARGYRLTRRLPRVDSGGYDLEQDASASRSKTVLAGQRPLKVLPIRYGPHGLACTTGETDNLSEGGLFIRCKSPLAEGTLLALELDLDGALLKLQGSVLWTREDAGDGRPPGMGVQLRQPPPRYVHYVRQHVKRETSLEPLPPEPPLEVLEEWDPEES